MTHKCHNPITIGAVIVSCLLLLSASSTLFAEAGIKFGVIDVEKVLEEYKKAMDARSLLKNEFKRLQKEIDKAEKQIYELYERKDKASNLNEELVAKMDRDISIKLKEREDLVRNHQKAISDKEKELFEPILKEVEDLIQKIGKEEKYGLIVRRLVTLYVDPKYDITDKVLKILNEKYDKEQSEKKIKAKDEKKKADKKDDSKPKPVTK